MPDLISLRVYCLALAILAAPGLSMAYPILCDHICYRVLSETERTVEVCGLDNKKNPGHKIHIPEKILYKSRTYRVTAIGPEAFSEPGPARISAIRISASVVGISDRAFYKCRALERLTVDPANPAFFSDGQILLTKDKKEVVGCVPNVSKGTRIDLPATVTVIRPYAFYGCSLTKISMPSVTHISQSAFAGSALTAVSLPASLTYIGPDAFRATKLTRITLPPGVTAVNPGTFALCTQLQDVTLPPSVRLIETEAFAGCTRLARMNLPDGLTAIGAKAFAGCTALSDIHMSDSLTTIGHQAFTNCTGLGEIRLPSTVKSLGEQAFMGCTGLTSVSLASPDAHIGFQTFHNCTSLTRVILSGQSDIAESAFGGCDRIKEIHCAGEKPLTGRTDIWTDEVLRHATLYVPHGSRTAYGQADPWRNFWAITEQSPLAAPLPLPMDNRNERSRTDRKATADAGQEQ